MKPEIFVINYLVPTPDENGYHDHHLWEIEAVSFEQAEAWLLFELWKENIEPGGVTIVLPKSWLPPMTDAEHKLTFGAYVEEQLAIGFAVRIDNKIYQLV